MYQVFQHVNIIHNESNKAGKLNIVNRILLLETRSRIFELIL